MTAAPRPHDLLDWYIESGADEAIGEVPVDRFAAAKAQQRAAPPKGATLTSLASRDVRLFILMAGALTGQGFATLIVLASLTNIVVLVRVLYMRKVLKGG